MSTYLLAICVGEFDMVQTTTSHGVVVSVYTPPGKSHMGQYALHTASLALSAYDDFFQVPYPLPKLDMIAIPEFAMGAMEVCRITVLLLILIVQVHCRLSPFFVIFVNACLELGLGYVPRS